MPDFEIAYKRLMTYELDELHPDKVTKDGGGLTKYGISQNAFPSLNIMSLTMDTAKNLTKHNYWLYSKWNLDVVTNISQPVANKLLDIAFNLGVATAVDFLRTYEIFLGYKLPPQTENFDLSLLHADENKFLLTYLCGMQMSRYIKDYHGLYRVPSNTIKRAMDVT